MQALSELHDQIPPFPRAEAIKIIEDELGFPVDEYFSYVSEDPVAAASFGQVWKAFVSCYGLWNYWGNLKIDRPRKIVSFFHFAVSTKSSPIPKMGSFSVILYPLFLFLYLT